MAEKRAAPAAENGYLYEHAMALVRSYTRWTGTSLLDPALPPERVGPALWEIPVVVVSHDTAPDPIFNYGNRAALARFEMTWDEFTALPSRMSAEPVHRDERARLMAEVSQRGYIADYQGIRIARSGRRFRITRATVWNIVDEAGNYLGQAAAFDRWEDLVG